MSYLPFCQSHHFVEVTLANFLNTVAEIPLRIVQQVFRSVKFLNFSFLENQNFVVADDGVQSVGDGNNSGLFEFALQHFLDQVVCLHVDASGCLI